MIYQDLFQFGTDNFHQNFPKQEGLFCVGDGGKRFTLMAILARDKALCHADD